MSPVLNGERLKSVAHATHTAEIVATALAMRQRGRNETNVTLFEQILMRSGEKIVHDEYIQFWKDMQSAGLGSLVFGRKGGDTRFMWHYSLKSVAKAMIEGNTIEIERLPSEKVVKKATPTRTKAKRGRPPGRKNMVIAKPDNKMIKEPQPTPSAKLVYISLRPDFNVEINVPYDFNGRELGLIQDALKRAL